MARGFPIRNVVRTVRYHAGVVAVCFLALAIFCPRANAQTTPQLHVPLRFENGGVVPDISAVQLLNPTPAAEKDRSRFLKLITDRLRALGPACRWNADINALKWKTVDVEKLDGSWLEGTAKLQAWFTSSGGEEAGNGLAFWATDVLGAVLAGEAVEDGPFGNFSKNTPLRLVDTDAFEIGSSGILVFDVTAPLAAEELAAIVHAENFSADPIVAGIRRSLLPLVGKLWWNDDVLAAAGDHLRLYAIEPVQELSLTGFFLKADAEDRRLYVVGPTALATVGVVTTALGDEIARQLLIGAYNLLPTPYFQRLKTSAPEEKYGVKPVSQPLLANTHVVNFESAGLVPPKYPPFFLGLDTTALSASRLSALGYTQSIEGDSTKVIALFSPPPEKTLAPSNGKPSPTARPKNHLVFQAGTAAGTDYAGSVTYRRQQVDGTDEILISAGTKENLFEGQGAYTWDYVGFPRLSRKLSLSLEGGREAATDRQVTDRAATEKQDRATGRVSVEVWRNLRAHWLTLDLSVNAMRSRLQKKDEATSGFNVKDESTTAVLHLIYAHEGYGGGLPWTDVEGEFGSGWGSGDSADNYRWTRWSVVHRRVPFNGVRWVARARGHFADGDIPLSERPAFGGEDSVRGFLRDTARGDGTWSVQNELWFRTPENLPLPQAIGTFVRRNLWIALFFDAGGVTRPSDHKVSIASGAGVGLRFVQGPLTVRADWGHSVNARGDVSRSNAGYLTIEYRPAF